MFVVHFSACAKIQMTPKSRLIVLLSPTLSKKVKPRIFFFVVRYCVKSAFLPWGGHGTVLDRSACRTATFPCSSSIFSLRPSWLIHRWRNFLHPNLAQRCSPAEHTLPSANPHPDYTPRCSRRSCKIDTPSDMHADSLALFGWRGCWVGTSRSTSKILHFLDFDLHQVASRVALNLLSIKSSVLVGV